MQVAQQPPQFPLQEAPGGPPGHRKAVCTWGGQWACVSGGSCACACDPAGRLCVRAPRCSRDSGRPPATRPAASGTRSVPTPPQPEGGPVTQHPWGRVGQGSEAGDGGGRGKRREAPAPGPPAPQLPAAVAAGWPHTCTRVRAHMRAGSRAGTASIPRGGPRATRAAGSREGGLRRGLSRERRRRPRGGGGAALRRGPSAGWASWVDSGARLGWGGSRSCERGGGRVPDGSGGGRPVRPEDDPPRCPGDPLPRTARPLRPEQPSADCLGGRPIPV